MTPPVWPWWRTEHLTLVKRQGELDVLKTVLPRARRAHRYRPHPLGHLRQAVRRERPSVPVLRRQAGHRPQRHHRELHGPEGEARRPKGTFHLADRHRGHRAPDGEALCRTICTRPWSDTVQEIQGTYAIAAVREGSKEIVAARKENPLVIGLGVKENFVASDVTALLSYTNKVLYIMDGETVSMTPDEVTIFDSERSDW